MDIKSKSGMVHAIKTHHRVMQAYFELANIDKDLYRLPEDIEQFSMNVIRETYKWYEDVARIEYADLRRIWTSQTPRNWEQLKTIDLDFDDYPEVIILNRCLLAFRCKFTHRVNKPAIFKKTHLAKIRKTKVDVPSRTSTTCP